jgi:hypothetical protein
VTTAHTVPAENLVRAGQGPFRLRSTDLIVRTETTDRMLVVGERHLRHSNNDMTGVVRAVLATHL